MWIVPSPPTCHPESLRPLLLLPQYTHPTWPTLSSDHYRYNPAHHEVTIRSSHQNRQQHATNIFLFNLPVWSASSEAFTDHSNKCTDHERRSALRAHLKKHASFAFPRICTATSLKIRDRKSQGLDCQSFSWRTRPVKLMKLHQAYSGMEVVSCL